MECLISKPPLSSPLPPCKDTLSPASSKKRRRGIDTSADDSTPSPIKSCRPSPHTPELKERSSRLRPRKLGFDASVQQTDLQSSFAPVTPSEKDASRSPIEKRSDEFSAPKQTSDLSSSQLTDKGKDLPRTPSRTPSTRASPRLLEKTSNKDSAASVLKPKSLHFAPATPQRKPSDKRLPPLSPYDDKSKTSSTIPKRKLLDHVIVDRVKFVIGDDVYVKRTDDEIDEEAEGCLICGKAGKLVECDSCSRGVHLKCADPPLKKVPDGEWLCPKCESASKPSSDGLQSGLQKSGAEAPKTARELLLASKLWAARIERIWKNEDGSLWFLGRWYLIPEETSIGRQPHNLRRELFLTNDVDENEIASIFRKCYVMGPEEFRNSGRDGDDVFLCEYEYDTRFHTFKRISDMENDGQADDTEDDYSEGEEEEDSDGEVSLRYGKKSHFQTPPKAANCRGGNLKVGTKSIPHNARRKPATVFERAKAALRLTATPGSLPCREREMTEISSFVTDAVVSGNKGLGHCLYISGVPGTGKTATVMEVMQKLKRKYEEQNVNPYRFVEINGLRLTSPEHLYTVLYEALTGHHVGWKKALQFLDERFSNPNPSRRADAKPCILFIDELDLLVTRNQSVLYNIFDWPTRPHSRLFVIGIANTIDLPERLLPRIASRMGLQRLSFSPYSHEQLQTVISSRLEAINAFEKQAIEFASRKVAAVSGDARRALELCRRAVEVAESRSIKDSNKGNCVAKGNLVSIKDVEEAIKEMFQAPHIKMMGRCPKQAKIFLVSMVYEQHKTGMVETTFEKVSSTFTFLCRNNNEKIPDWDTLLFIGCALGACRLILCEPGSHHRIQKLQLNFPTDDVSFALKQDQEIPWIGKYL